MSIRKHWKLGAVALSGLAIGAGASAITSAGATTSPGTGTSAGAGTGAGAAVSATQPAAPGRITLRRLAARTVAGDLTVETKAGFDAVTFERGFVQSVSGQRLTLSEGTRKATYKTVTVTIPATARVLDNGSTATLEELTSGQHVLVIQGAKQTLVRARTAGTP